MGSGLATMLLPAQATAEDILTTGAYRETCSRQDAEAIAFCSGYVKAIMDFAQKTGKACIRDGTPPEDTLIAVRAFTFDKIGTPGFPETQPAILMVLAVITKVHPCKS